VLVGSFGRAFLVGITSRGQSIMVSGIVGSIAKQRGEMAASLRKLAVPHADIRKAGLRFFGYFRGKMLPAGQSAEHPQRILVASYLVKIASNREHTIGQVERPAHDAASLQRVGRSCRRRSVPL